MGTASFTVGRGNKSRRDGSYTILSTTKRTSGSYTTSTSASNVEDGSGDITIAAGDVLQIHASEAMWINFGGVAAAVGTGFYIPAGETRQYECEDAGTVSAIDVA